MRARKQSRERQSSAVVDDAAARLAEIVEAAEKAAARVIDDAEGQARRILDEARERADRVVAERLRELADELDPPVAGGDRSRRRLGPVDDVPEPPAMPRPDSAGARLLATQMAVSGAERAEIEARLRSGFDIEDTSEILDAILGPEE
jgi:cell division septum initiation protein DivIVA